MPGYGYTYPVEIKISTNFITNYYLNFGIQTVGFINVVLFVQTNFLIFLIVNINLIFYLQLIAKMSEKIGDSNIDFGKRFKNPCKRIILSDIDNPSSSLSSNLIEDVKIKRSKKNVNQMAYKKNTVKTRPEEEFITVLSTIVKYHTDALT